jgi:membrane protein YqaA with SNARE-associated domain
MTHDADPALPAAPTPGAQETPAAPPPANPLRTRILQGLVFAAVIGLTIYIYSLGDNLLALQAIGLPGLFLITFLANATIVLPAPGLLVVASFAGTGLPWWAVGLVAGLGATLGEMSGYLAGSSGRAIVPDRKTYNRLEGWMRRYGPLTIVALAFIPSPLFDLAGVIAVALKMRWYVFLFWCFVGKLPKMLLVAYAGSAGIDWLKDLFTLGQSP